MKAPTSNKRFEEAKKVLDYGFKNYEYKQFGVKGSTVGNVIIEKGVEKETNAILEENCGILIRKGEENKVVQNMHLESKVSAPIQEGQKIGNVEYSIDGKLIQSINIVVEKEVKKETFGNVTAYLYKKWFCLLRK